MKKYFKLIVVCLAVMLITAGCTNGNTNDNNTNNNENPNTSTDNNQNTSKKDVVGKLVGIGDDEIKVYTNGTTETYKLSGDKVKDYYLGETIMLKSNSEGKYEATSYEDYNFNDRMTDMGEKIKRSLVTVKEVGEDFITAIAENGEFMVQNPGNFNLPANTNVIFDYVETPNGNRLVSYYDESVKIDLTIKAISRDVNGQMVIIATDENNKEYEISVAHDVLLNVRHSTLKTGDKISCYPVSISDDNPAKINANMIIKQQ